MGEIVSCCHPQDVMRLTETQLIERYHRRDSLNPSPLKAKMSLYPSTRSLLLSNCEIYCPFSDQIPDCEARIWRNDNTNTHRNDYTNTHRLRKSLCTMGISNDYCSRARGSYRAGRIH